MHVVREGGLFILKLSVIQINISMHAERVSIVLTNQYPSLMYTVQWIYLRILFLVLSALPNLYLLYCNDGSKTSVIWKYYFYCI